MKTSRRPLILASLLLLLVPAASNAQGGSGSKGGVVMACFDSNPRLFMDPVDEKRDIYIWPVISDSDRLDQLTLAAKEAKMFDAVNRLKSVVLDEYRDVRDTPMTARDDVYAAADTNHHLHPMLFLIRQLGLKLMPLPETHRLSLTESRMITLPDGSMADRLDHPDKLSPEDAATVRAYASDEEDRLDKYRTKSMPIFHQLYGMVFEMFRGVPGLYTRLAAAHKTLGAISTGRTTYSGNPASQWDSKNISAMTNWKADKGSKCIKMTAADRQQDHVTVIYDRYLWHHMDLFQRVLLQLHEEFYFMGSDVAALGLTKFHPDSDHTRILVSRFARGERESRESGPFQSTCAQYDESIKSSSEECRQSSGTFCPSVKLIESGACTGAKSDRTLIPQAKSGDVGKLEAPKATPPNDALAFLEQFVCDGGCPRATQELWQKIAVGYGPYSSSGLQTLLSYDNFGKFTTIEKLVEQRNYASKEISKAAGSYEQLNAFCDKAGYGKAPYPQPDPNNAYRQESQTGAEETEMLKWESVLLDLKPPRDSHKKRDNYADFTIVNSNIQALQKDDYPDHLLESKLEELEALNLPPSLSALHDLRLNGKGRNKEKKEQQLNDACNDIRAQNQQMQSYLRNVDGLTFYETWGALNPLGVKISQ